MRAARAASAAWPWPHAARASRQPISACGPSGWFWRDGITLYERALAVTADNFAIHAFLAIYGVDQAADLLAHTIVATIGPATLEAAASRGRRESL